MAEYVFLTRHGDLMFCDDFNGAKEALQHKYDHLPETIVYVKVGSQDND